MTINPHLTPTACGELQPGMRVVNGFLNPTRPDAHQLARIVAEIVRTYRAQGFDEHGMRGGTPRLTYYDYTVIEWRDSNGSLFADRADQTVYTVTDD
jgi:hypothetical protein